jgi:hypothetical protein
MDRKLFSRLIFYAIRSYHNLLKKILQGTYEKIKGIAASRSKHQRVTVHREVDSNIAHSRPLHIEKMSEIPNI